jgi:hypothetical protein
MITLRTYAHVMRTESDLAFLDIEPVSNLETKWKPTDGSPSTDDPRSRRNLDEKVGDPGRI